MHAAEGLARATNRPRMPRPQPCRLSLVVPVLNEEEAIPVFLAEVDRVLGPTGLELEIVFVDDGSTDATAEVIARHAARDPRIRAVLLSRNFGKEAALSAGLDRTTGDAVVPIDVDLQDPLALVPVFVAHWREGYDVVYGVRSDRSSDSWLKRMSAGLFYRVFNAVADTRIPMDTGDFRLMDRRVVAVVRQLPERERFMKGLFAWVGFRSLGVPFERPLRSVGSSKWKAFRLWRFAVQGLTSFSTLPLQVWVYLGALIAAFSFLYGSFIVVRTLVLGIDLPGYPSLMTVVLFLGGVQLLSLGVIGEYIGRLYVEVKGRPLYVVDREILPPVVAERSAKQLEETA